MSIAGTPKWSSRQERAESSRLAWAFTISFALHLVLFGTYRVGKEFHVWERLQWPAWIQSAKMLTELFKKPNSAALRRQQEELKKQEDQIPLMFVDVSPAKAVAEPPKKAAYYSDRNSLAANPEPKLDSTVPQVDGQETHVAKTEDVPRTQAFPLRPTPAPPEPPAPKPEEARNIIQPKPVKPAEPKPPEPKPAEPKPIQPPREVAQRPPAPPPGETIRAKPADKPTDKPADLAMLRPTPVLPPPSSRAQENGEAPRPSRPRTIKEALARQPDGGRAGRKMKQEGGVHRHGLESSLDVIATPFGAYDAALVAAVQARWDFLLDQRDFSRDRTGKVVLKFRLHPDGSVSEMRILENTVDLTLALLCQSSIHDPAPYAPWPSDMRRLIGADYREVTFTFFYN